MAALTIARARLRNGGDNGRRRLEAALGQVELPSLGPRAVLFVPRLAPTAPLQTRSPRAFRDATARALLDAACNATRARSGQSWGGPLLFDCEADFLAWLIDGWGRRSPEQVAALAAIAQPRSIETFIAADLLSRGELLPPLFAALAARAALPAFLARLQPAEAARARAAMSAAYAIAAVTLAEETAKRLPGAEHPERRRDVAPEGGPDPAAGTATTGARAGGGRPTAILMALHHLAEIAPEAMAPPMAGEIAALAGLALALIRAPAWARSLDAALAVAALTKGTVPPSQVSGQPAQRAAAPTVGAKAATEVGLPAPAAAVPHGPSTALSPAEPPPREPSEPAVSPRRVANLPPSEATARVSPRLAGTDSPAPVVASVASGLIIESRFAGLLFFINLFLHLEYYPDFKPAGRNLPVSPWLLLRRLGRNWLRTRLVADPLDSLLSMLAGLAPDAPLGRPLRGLGFRRLAEEVRDEAARRIQRPERDAIRLIACQPSRIIVCPGALDAEFSLDAHPLPIRMAALDRDPGWIPAAGRTIGFHFQ